MTKYCLHTSYYLLKDHHIRESACGKNYIKNHTRFADFFLQISCSKCKKSKEYLELAIQIDAGMDQNQAFVNLWDRIQEKRKRNV